MAYSVWMLEASNITVSGGKSLSGITQGDGSHLVGETIRLDNNHWIETLIQDNDTRFDDNDADQRLDGAQTIDGTTYADGTRVEAEYRITLRDPDTGETWQVLGFNVNNSSPAFGTIEGLAFVGPVGGFPPVGRDLQVVAAAEGPGSAGQPAIDAGGLASPPCFTPGTLIRTPSGAIPVERLAPGDRVATRDHGAQPLVWVGRVRVDATRLAASPAFVPVRLRAGAFGPGRPARDMLLSQQHRVLVGGWRAELLFGETEVLAPVRHLVNGRSIALASDVARIDYIHLMCARHEIVWADGIETETFLPGAQGLGSIPAAARAEVLALFPELARGAPLACLPARPLLKAWEARLVA